ncbi:putative isopenicillin N synthase [Rosa chinensis]|uniref:Putative isopenicillin N synthase n=1 Tax=Rosa chinensis TaxID=74649 RepID=A0A2P6PMW4_ROSCH|nr:putative isopenicillin N synthase [Rosa chinensis]
MKICNLTRDACKEYAQEVENLLLKLMGLIVISLSLGLPESKNRFGSFFKDQSSSVALNYYPPRPSPHLAVGVGHHRDGVL